ncbi:hypothetical protein V8C35DRAFT_317128 [Trichoderma chlorosporum]
MDSKPVILGDPDVTRDEEDGSPTQPFSSPGLFALENNNHTTNDVIYNATADGLEGDDESTATDESGENEDDSGYLATPENKRSKSDVDSIDDNDGKSAVAKGDAKSEQHDSRCLPNDGGEKDKDITLIDNSYHIHMVTWKDANGQRNQIHNLGLDMYMNTSANTAMFKLYSYINLKGSRRKSNRQSAYLFIYPERIRAISAQISSNESSAESHTVMHFSLIQRPDLIGPQDRAFASKDKTSTQLDLLQDLSLVTEFTIHLAASGTLATEQKDFASLTTVFSATNTEIRPRRDNKRGNLATLYAGKGGEIIIVDPGVMHKTNPPSYSATLSSLNKRRRPDSDDEGPAVTRMPHIAQYFESLTRLIDTRFNHLERSIKELNTRFNHLERSIGEVKDTIRDLDTSHTPCRFDTEERDGIVQEVKELCDDHDITFKVASQDLLDDIEVERNKTIDQVREECDEITDQYRDEIHEAQEDIKMRVKALQNTRVRFDGTLIIDI